MNIKLISYGTDEYRQMLRLRDDVLRRPLGMRIEDDDLRQEVNDMLIGAFEGSDFIGCCVISREDEHTARLRQMAVAAGSRKSGIGRRLIRFAEETARKSGYKMIMLHARESAKNFYLKSGYKINGDKFTEVSIPHFPMIKLLALYPIQGTKH